jgi:Arc/MetJ-type ribon-helix-helix transcriptional regulator
MNVALTDDLERLLRKVVEDGRFPNEEAVVQQALRSFLVEDPTQGSPQKSFATEIQEERLPGSFIEDDTTLGAFELPREGREVTSSTLREPMRLPDRFPGE